MSYKRHKPEEILSKLRTVDSLCAKGMTRIDAIREIDTTEQTYYRWRKRYQKMLSDESTEILELQLENERLRRAVSDLTLDKLALLEAAKGKS